MKRSYFIITLFAMLLMFNGCSKEDVNQNVEKSLTTAKEDIKNLYHVTAKYGLTQFNKRYGKLTADFDAITITKQDNKEIVSLPLRMDFSTNVNLHLVMINQNGKGYAQISEFIADPHKNSQIKTYTHASDGILNIYRVNGHFYKKYAVNDRHVSFMTDQRVKKAGITTSSNGDDDDDSDGVPNKDDKCPDTPADTWVDPNGCPVDNELPEVNVPHPGTPTTPGNGGTNPNPGGTGDPEDNGTPGEGGEDEGSGGAGAGGGGGGGSSFLYNLIEDPCLGGILDSILNSNITFKANETLQSIFGWSGKFNIKYMESTTMPNNIHGTAQPTKILYDSDGKITDMDVDVFLNMNTLQNASREYAAMVIIHESIHAYLDYQGYSYNTNQHDLMLSQYLEVIALYLIDHFNTPEQDAYSLAMEGLYEAFQNSINNQTWEAVEEKYKNKIPSLNDRSRIMADHETGLKGSKCN